MSSQSPPKKNPTFLNSSNEGTKTSWRQATSRSSDETKQIKQSPSYLRQNPNSTVDSKISPRLETKIDEKENNSESLKLHYFEADKIGFTLQKTRKVLEINLENGELSSRDVYTQNKKVHSIPKELIQVRKSQVEPTKLKLFWKNKENPEKLIFTTKRNRERFVELVEFSMRGRQDVLETHENLSVYVTTWNLGNAPPPDSNELMTQWIPPGYDIYFITTQECEYIPVTKQHPTCEGDFFDRIEACFDRGKYSRLANISLWTMRTCLYIKSIHLRKISHLHSDSLPTGIGNLLGNKGATAISFFVNDTSFCFIGCHLAPHMEKVKERNLMYTDILAGFSRSFVREPYDLSTYFHHIFWTGDLNYRISNDRQLVIDKIEEKDWDFLKKYDQLMLEMRENRCFVDWNESEINFIPSYRYNRGDRTWSEEKMRVPSWCDRVLWKSFPSCQDQVVVKDYNTIETILTSDHNPVYCLFSVGSQLGRLPSSSTICNIVISDIQIIPYTSPSSPIQSSLSLSSSNSLTPVTTSSSSLSSSTSSLPPSSPVETNAQSSPPSPTNSLSTLIGGASSSSSFSSFFAPSSQNLQTIDESSNLSQLTFTSSFFDEPIVLSLNIQRTVKGQEIKVKPLIYDHQVLKREHILVSLSPDPNNYQGVVDQELEGKGLIPLEKGLDKDPSRVTIKILKNGFLKAFLDATLHVIWTSEKDEEQGQPNRSDIIKQGFLMKQGGVVKTWKRRWCVLKKNGYLTYFVNPEDVEVQGELDVSECNVRQVELLGKQFSFVVETTERLLYMIADSETHLRDWFSAFNQLKETQPKN